MEYASVIVNPNQQQGKIVSLKTRIIHKLRREAAEMPVMARKTSESTGGVFEAYVEDR